MLANMVHHADDGADHAPSRRAIPVGAVNLGALVEPLQEDIAVALHRVLDELAVVAVAYVADALRQEAVVDLDVLERHRAALADHVGDLRQLLDEIARMRRAQGEREADAHGQSVHDDREGEADHRRGRRAAENDDHGVLVEIAGEIAAVDQDQNHDRGDAADQADARCDIHLRLF